MTPHQLGMTVVYLVAIEALLTIALIVIAFVATVGDRHSTSPVLVLPARALFVVWLVVLVAICGFAVAWLMNH